MPIDIDISHYNTGTATVAASGTAVTGQGTTWVGAIRPGDLFGTHVGDGIRILTVDSNTSLTLAYPWPGAAQTAAAYEIQRTPFDLGYQQAVEELLQAISNGNLPSFAALVGAANTMPYFTGAGAFGVTGLSAFARTLLDDADAAAFWGTIGETAPAQAAYRRGNILGTVSQSGGVPTGAVIQRGSTGDGEFVRFADGTQICWSDNVGVLQPTQAVGALFRSSSPLSWSFPATFSATPINIPKSQNHTATWASANSGNTANCTIHLWSPSSLPGTDFVMAGLAIGRWF